MTQKKYLCFEAKVNKNKATFILKRRFLFILLKYYYWIGIIPSYMLFRFSKNITASAILFLIWVIVTTIYIRETKIIASGSIFERGLLFLNKEKKNCKKEGSIFSKEKPLKYVCKKESGYWDEKDLDVKRGEVYYKGEEVDVKQIEDGANYETSSVEIVKFVEYEDSEDESETSSVTYESEGSKI